MFSIVIPTLQKNTKILKMLLDELNKDTAVGEIIIIDNSLQGFEYNSDKIRVIIPKKNLFVNPSWNLGAKEAKFEFVGILNDDILIPENLCSEIHKFLQDEEAGVVGVDETSITETTYNDDTTYPENNQEIIYTPQENELYIGYWGIAIFGRKKNFFKIPKNIKIWCGDNYLLKRNEEAGHKNYQFKCSNILHIGSLSSGSSKLDYIKHRDIELFAKIDKKFKNHDWYPKHSINKFFTLTNSADKKYKHLIILGKHFRWERTKA